MILLYTKLGIPVSDELRSFLKRKDAKRATDATRKKSKAYNKRQKQLRVQKQAEKEKRAKKSKALGHGYSESKELFPEKSAKRKRNEKVEMNFEANESVYYGFKIEGLSHLTWYRGDIKKAFSKKTPKGNLKKYCDVLFDDGNKGFGIPSGDLSRTLPAGAIQYERNKKV